MSVKPRRVAAFDRFHQFAGLPQFGRQLLHPDPAEVAAERFDAAHRFRRCAAQIIEMIAARPGEGEPPASPLCQNTRTGSGHRAMSATAWIVGVVRPASASCFSASRSLIELPDRGLEGARQAIELAGGRVAKTAIEQRGADPCGRGERQDRGGEKGGDQAVAKSVHAQPCVTAGPGMARPLPSETSSHWPGGGSACRLCPAASGLVFAAVALAIEDPRLETNPERLAASEPSPLTGTASCWMHHASAAAAVRCETDRDPVPDTAAANRSSQRS